LAVVARDDVRASLPGGEHTTAPGHPGETSSRQFTVHDRFVIGINGKIPG
jgi:hypothetical protein